MRHNRSHRRKQCISFILAASLWCGPPFQVEADSVRNPKKIYVSRDWDSVYTGDVAARQYLKDSGFIRVVYLPSPVSPNYRSALYRLRVKFDERSLVYVDSYSSDVFLAKAKSVAQAFGLHCAIVSGENLKVSDLRSVADQDCVISEPTQVWEPEKEEYVNVCDLFPASILIGTSRCSRIELKPNGTGYYVILHGEDSSGFKLRIDDENIKQLDSILY